MAVHVVLVMLNYPGSLLHAQVQSTHQAFILFFFLLISEWPVMSIGQQTYPAAHFVDAIADGDFYQGGGEFKFQNYNKPVVGFLCMQGHSSVYAKGRT